MTVSCTCTCAPDAPNLLDARTGETEGAYVVIEVIAPPGIPGPPPHAHSTHEAAFCVRDGAITLHIGERQILARPGAFAPVPRGMMHAHRNTGRRAARLRVLLPRPDIAPRFAEPATRCAPPDDRLDLAAIAAIVVAAHAHGPEVIESMPRAERGAGRHKRLRGCDEPVAAAKARRSMRKTK